MSTQSETTIKEMLKAAVHFGHRSQKWNPKMAKYIYTKKQGIHIFDLLKTYECLEKALQFIHKSSAEGKIILFVSTKQQAAKLISEAAQKCQMPHVTQKWMGGLVTNFSTIKKRIKYLKDLKEQEKNGEFEKYTKKEAGNLKKTIIKLEGALGGVADLQRLPDVIFIVDTLRDKIAIKEAKKSKIPVVAIVDSNGDPSLIDYPIPGNDDAIKPVEYMINKVTEAIISGRQKK